MLAPCPSEFRRAAVELLNRSGKPMRVLASEARCLAAVRLKNWAGQIDLDEGKAGPELSRAEELRRLRRENRILAAEGTISKKARPSSPRTVDAVRCSRSSPRRRRSTS